MAWTTPRTWVVGEIVTAAIMNTHVRDELNFIGSFLSTGTLTAYGFLLGSGTLPIAAMAALSTGQVAIGATAGTAAPTAVAVFNSAGGALKSTYGGLNSDVSTGTKGAVLVASATGSYTSLPVGSDGQLLQATSGAALGVAWVNPANVVLLKGGSGTYTATGSGTLDSTVVTGLGPRDVLLIYYSIAQVGSAGTGLQLGVGGTGTVNLLAGSSFGNATNGHGHSVLRLLNSSGNQFGNVEMAGIVTTAGSPAGGAVTLAVVDSSPTAWTSNLAVALNHRGNSVNGTSIWSWALFKLQG